jgi:hypothetical protein
VNAKRPSPRTIRVASAGTAAAALLAAFAAVAGAGLSSTSSSASEYEYGPGGHQYGKQKVTLCHHTHSKKHPTVTITVGAPAVKAHLKHGDTVGACPAVVPATNTKKQHGKGKSADHSSASDTHGKPADPGNGNQGGHGNNGHGK